MVLLSLSALLVMFHGVLLSSSRLVEATQVDIVEHVLIVVCLLLLKFSDS